jgi:AraC family transcriptional regulator of adaptative response / DNA-3-methyladenine glycosylase II
VPSLDFDGCYGAVLSRDPRFDGWFFTAVTTTGVYCRPSCPATTPKRNHVRFFATAAAAQGSGFRACKRCRPDATPGSPQWDFRADTVARAMRLIADGVVDREGVPGLAGRLSYSPRQLERLLVTAVGAGPLALARAQRAQTARILIETTGLPMANVAFAAGFASVRQFNETVRAVYAASPTKLRTAAGQLGFDREANHAQTVCLRLPFRRPLVTGSLLGHLAATAVTGVEEVRDGAYRRTLRLPRGPATVALRPAADHFAAAVSLADWRDLGAAVARCRRLLDLDADPQAVEEALRRDAVLGPGVTRAPGRRVPRCVDEEEMAVRAVLGQQVSMSSARAAARRLVQAHGEPLQDNGGGLTHLFPTVDRLAEQEVPGPAARARAVQELSRAMAGGALVLGPGGDRDEARRQLRRIPGVGPWTVEIIAMRALGDPDAFPASDAGVRRAASGLNLPAGGSALDAYSQRWRPWRAYAVQYLWSSLDHPANHWPPAVSPGQQPAANTRSVA